MLYVDKDCCKGDARYLAKHLPEWENLVVRQDIWHYMRRFTAGVSTESHALFPQFMSRLSAYIFEWDCQDLHNLMGAKKERVAEIRGESKRL